MSTIIEQCDRMLSAIDAELAAAPSTCWNCGDDSAGKPYCCAHCRWQLWKLRRGLERECLDLAGLR